MPSPNQPSVDQPRANPPAANPPAQSQGAAGAPRPAVTPQAAVTPPAVPPAAPAAPAEEIGTFFTAGLRVQPFGGGGEGARLDYARILARNVDSVAVSLGTPGQPTPGASGPATLTLRERDRWTTCRNLYWDFTTLAAGVRSVREGLPPNSPLDRAAAALDTALDETEALAECDNVASMISAPER
jgi:hypothetical protein